MRRRGRVLARILLAGAAVLALAACQEEETGAAGPLYRSELGAVPASAQRSGDSEAGRRALLNAPYVSCGIPYDAYRRVVPETAPEDRLPERAGRNAELPYALTAHVNADGVEIVSSNCLTCHAGRIEEELIIGLGNEFADFTADPRRLARHLLEVEQRRLGGDTAGDVVGTLHQEQDVVRLGAGEHLVDPGQPLRRPLAPQPVVLHRGVDAGAAEEGLQPRRVAALFRALAGAVVEADARGDAVAEGQVAGLAGGGKGEEEAEERRQEPDPRRRRDELWGSDFSSGSDRHGETPPEGRNYTPKRPTPPALRAAQAPAAPPVRGG